MKLNSNVQFVKEITEWAEMNWKHFNNGDLDVLINEAFYQMADEIKNGETGGYELRAWDTNSGRPETFSNPNFTNETFL